MLRYANGTEPKGWLTALLMVEPFELDAPDASAAAAMVSKALMATSTGSLRKLREKENLWERQMGQIASQLIERFDRFTGALSTVVAGAIECRPITTGIDVSWMRRGDLSALRQAKIETPALRGLSSGCSRYNV